MRSGPERAKAAEAGCGSDLERSAVNRFLDPGGGLTSARPSCTSRWVAVLGHACTDGRLALAGAEYVFFRQVVVGDQVAGLEIVSMQHTPRKSCELFKN